MKRRDMLKALAVPAVIALPTLPTLPTLPAALPSADPLALRKHLSGELELVFRPIPSEQWQEIVERMVLIPQRPWLT